MTQQASHSGTLTQSGLQQSLRMAEATLFKLLSIGVSGNQTISEHDDATPVPPLSLVLVLDPNGDVAAPEGTSSTPICRGEARIGNQTKRVALFRKGAAVEAEEAAGPAQPAQPAPEGVGDTGPEGNPNLNSDGTPRTGAPAPPAQPSPELPGDTGPEGNPNLNSDGTPRTGTPPPPSPPPANAGDEPTGGADDV